MLNILEPDENFVTVVDRTTCPHHQRQPWDRAFAGCTCCSSMTRRRATTEEREENIRCAAAEQERRRQHMADYDAGKIK